MGPTRYQDDDSLPGGSKGCFRPVEQGPRHFTPVCVESKQVATSDPGTVSCNAG